MNFKRQEKNEVYMMNDTNYRNDELIKSIREVCDYLYHDEYEHWMENGQPKEDHIYNHVHRLEEYCQILESGNTRPPLKAGKRCLCGLDEVKDHMRVGFSIT